MYLSLLVVFFTDINTLRQATKQIDSDPIRSLDRELINFSYNCFSNIFFFQLFMNYLHKELSEDL